MELFYQIEKMQKEYNESSQVMDTLLLQKKELSREIEQINQKDKSLRLEIEEKKQLMIKK